MTVRRLDDGTIALEGVCPAGEAEALRSLVLATPDAAIDWGTCERAHTAIVQVLLAARKAPRGTPSSAILEKLFERGAALL